MVLYMDAPLCPRRPHVLLPTTQGAVTSSQKRPLTGPLRALVKGQSREGVQEESDRNPDARRPGHFLCFPAPSANPRAPPAGGGFVLLEALSHPPVPALVMTPLPGEDRQPSRWGGTGRKGDTGTGTQSSLVPGEWSCVRCLQRDRRGQGGAGAGTRENTGCETAACAPLAGRAPSRWHGIILETEFTGNIHKNGEAA